MPVCVICGFKGVDLSYHLKSAHNQSVKCYKKEFNGKIIDPSVDMKRKQTCFERYNNSNYKNREAIKLSNEIFEGGHRCKKYSQI